MTDGNPMVVVWCAVLGLASAANAHSVSGNLGFHGPSTVCDQDDKYCLFSTGPGIIAKQSNDRCG